MDMYTKQELAAIMSALVDKAMSTKYMIENKEYECEEELQSLEQQAKMLDNLASKTLALFRGGLKHD